MRIGYIQYMNASSLAVGESSKFWSTMGDPQKNLWRENKIASDAHRGDIVRADKAPAVDTSGPFHSAAKTQRQLYDWVNSTRLFREETILGRKRKWANYMAPTGYLSVLLYNFGCLGLMARRKVLGTAIQH